MAYWLRPSTACIRAFAVGSEDERQARMAGFVPIPDADLRRVASLTKANRQRWAETRTSL